MRRTLAAIVVTAFLGTCPPASAQTTSPDDGPREIDECGTLVRAGNCFLFEGAGGLWVLVEPGDFAEGEEIRVVGTADPDCISICGEADGCIRGATVYDPAVLPCGEPLPNFPGDLVSNVCAGVGGTLALVALAGFASVHRGKRWPSTELDATRPL